MSERLRENLPIVLATVLILDAPYALRRPALPDRFAGRVLDLGLPCRLDELYHVTGHRNVVQLERHLLAALVGPAEELQDFLGLVAVGLRFVHQDEGRSGDRPAVLARLVGEDLVEAGRVLPVGAGGGGLEGLVVRGDEHAVLVLQQRVRHLVLLGVSVLDVADRAFDALHEGSHALITLATRARRRRPGYRSVVADLVLPLGAYLGEVVGEDEGRTGTVGTMDHGNRLIG